MCDQCGRIFSFAEEGWEEYQRRGNSSNYGANGNSITMHICGRHRSDAGGVKALTPRVDNSPDYELDRQIEEAKEDVERDRRANPNRVHRDW